MQGSVHKGYRGGPTCPRIQRQGKRPSGPESAAGPMAANDHHAAGHLWPGRSRRQAVSGPRGQRRSRWSRLSWRTTASGRRTIRSLPAASWSSRVGAHSLTCVSPTLSKIPYGEFSPVRLQTNFQTSDLRGRRLPLKCRPHSRAVAPYTPAQCTNPANPLGSQAVRDTRCLAQTRSRIAPIRARSSQPPHVRPEALGSPEGYAVPQVMAYYGLIRDSEAAMELSPLLVARRNGPERQFRGSPLYSTRLSVRAAFPTPAVPWVPVVV